MLRFEITYHPTFGINWDAWLVIIVINLVKLHKTSSKDSDDCQLLRFVETDCY